MKWEKYREVCSEKLAPDAMQIRGAGLEGAHAASVMHMSWRARAYPAFNQPITRPG